MSSFFMMKSTIFCATSEGFPEIHKQLVWVLKTRSYKLLDKIVRIYHHLYSHDVNDRDRLLQFWDLFLFAFTIVHRNRNSFSRTFSSFCTFPNWFEDMRLVSELNDLNRNLISFSTGQILIDHMRKRIIFCFKTK